MKILIRLTKYVRLSYLISGMSFLFPLLEELHEEVTNKFCLSLFPMFRPSQTLKTREANKNSILFQKQTITEVAAFICN